MDISAIQQWVYAMSTAMMTMFVVGSCIYFFAGSQKRKERLEQGGMIPLTDEPVDPRMTRLSEEDSRAGHGNDHPDQEYVSNQTSH